MESLRETQAWTNVLLEGEAIFTAKEMTDILCSWDSLCNLSCGSPVCTCMPKSVLGVSIPATMSAGL